MSEARGCSSFLIIEPKGFCAGRASLKVERGKMKMIIGWTLYVLLKNISAKAVHVQKPIIIASTVRKPTTVVWTKAKYLKSESNKIARIYYTPSVDRGMQMSRHMKLEEHKQRARKCTFAGDQTYSSEVDSTGCHRTLRRVPKLLRRLPNHQRCTKAKLSCTIP